MLKPSDSQASTFMHLRLLKRKVEGLKHVDVSLIDKVSGTRVEAQH